MPIKDAKYTLWNVPKSEWTPIPKEIGPTPEERDALVDFARTLDDNRLSERLQPFETPVTQETLSKSVG